MRFPKAVLSSIILRRICPRTWPISGTAGFAFRFEGGCFLLNFLRQKRHGPSRSEGASTVCLGAVRALATHTMASCGNVSQGAAAGALAPARAKMVAQRTITGRPGRSPMRSCGLLLCTDGPDVWRPPGPAGWRYPKALSRAIICLRSRDCILRAELLGSMRSEDRRHGSESGPGRYKPDLRGTTCPAYL